MKAAIVFAVLVVSLYRADGDHLVVGNVANRVVVANHTIVEYNAIPFIKRVKYFFYSSLENKKIQVRKCANMTMRF